MAKTVMGLVDSSGKAEQVVEELIKNGIDRKDIGMVSSEALREAATAAGGATRGMAYGTLAGLLLGVATLAIPGLGVALVAGPAVPLLTTIAGAIAGGLIGALRAKGVPEDQAHFYAEGLRRGGTLIIVTARTDELATRTVEILKRNGAMDIDERAAQWKQQGWSGRFEGKQERADKTAEKAAQKAADKPVEKPARQETADEAEPVVVLSAVEIYDFEIEPAGQARERRTHDAAYSGEDRRKAA
jgi:hypothetical protein